MRSALIVGVAGTELSEREAAFLREARPCGFILFARNCTDREQIRALIAAVKHATSDHRMLVLIDQEGGRVQRLRPPLGRALPPAKAYGRLYAGNRGAACHAATLAARLLAEDLAELGINTNCAPVVDVPVPGSHDIIGDRAYGTTPGQVGDLGRAVAEGFISGGVLPVIKHIPGHGRATKDSHLDLPVVDATHAELSASDFAAFRNVRDMPAAMTAHVVFTSLDPSAPASTSEIVTRDIIRGEIGFKGLLMSDDLSMRALTGSLRERAESVIRAGSDVALHCNGNLDEMVEAAAGVPALQGESLSRFDRCYSVLTQSQMYDRHAAETVLASVIADHAARAESV